MTSILSVLLNVILVMAILDIIGNNTVFSGSIQNFSTLPYRRVDCLAKVANSVDVVDAIARLKTVVSATPNVAKMPVPETPVAHRSLSLFIDGG